MEENINQITPIQISESWGGLFTFKKATSSTSKGLRSPQLGALHAILAHIEEGSSQSGIIVMPTGTGKTETMLSFMVANKCHKVFVVVPTDALRSQAYDKFSTLGLLPKIEIVPTDIKLPLTNKVTSELSDGEWIEIIQNSNVIICTMALAATISSKIRNLLNKEMDFLFVDEAHHSQAKTWNDFISGFSNKKVLMFTATPFRNDGQKLKGKIIFNFPLRKAQEEGYYEKILFMPVMEYTKRDADEEIARKAVSQLKKDLLLGYNHIIMARCKDKKRAEEVFEFYKKYKEYNPVIIYSGVVNENNILTAIKDGHHRIVVCVDMLGEGFDLPQLKIAAIHDERQSLAVTLQLIGRFIRVSDGSLGKATFITNLAYPPIAAEVNSLYQHDADWNSLLPRISEDVIEEEIQLNDYLNEFKGSLVNEFSLQDIRPALSTEIYKATSQTTYFNNWAEGLTNAKSYDIKLSAYTDDMLVAILGKSSNVQWGTLKNIKNLTWNIIVVYYDAKHQRIYLNSSISLNGKHFLDSIFSNVIQLNGDCVYRIFANIFRLRLFSVGARLHNGKDISFQSYFGSSVQDGINELTQGRLIKNNLYGVGYRNGKKVSVGCSVKGKLWSQERANLLCFKKWCDEVGALITDSSFDTNYVLKNTLIPTLLDSYQNIEPIAVDWSYEIYEHGNLAVKFGDDYIPFDDIQLVIDYNTTVLGHNIVFNLVSENGFYRVQCDLIRNETTECVYSTRNTDKKIVLQGSETMSIPELFARFSPTIFLADNSEIHGVNLLSPKTDPCVMPDSNMYAMEWENVNLRNESQGSEPYVKDSIQYYFSNKIKSQYDYLIDDDGSGEIADLIGINTEKHTIDIALFHLKYASGGKVSNDINNLYQVCGQAQKSISWKYVKGNKFFDHILRRDQNKTKKGKSSSILKGCVNDLLKLREQASNKKEMIFRFFVNLGGNILRI